MLEKLKKIITDATPEEINTAAIAGAAAIMIFLMAKLITPDPANLPTPEEQ